MKNLSEEKQLKLLVVDDSSTMRRIIKNTLQRLGYEDIFEAENGVEAWDILDKNSDMGVLITDWNMPTISSDRCSNMVKNMEFCNNIRKIGLFLH